MIIRLVVLKYFGSYLTHIASQTPITAISGFFYIDEE